MRTFIFLAVSLFSSPPSEVAWKVHKNIKLYKQKQILYKPLATDKVTKWINF